MCMYYQLPGLREDTKTTIFDSSSLNNNYVLYLLSYLALRRYRKRDAPPFFFRFDATYYEKLYLLFFSSVLKGNSYIV